jgi:hypothetical protein
VPPPRTTGHPQLLDCGRCHDGYTSTSVNLGTHLDGKVDVNVLGCTTCHGDAGRTSGAGGVLLAAAPPADTTGSLQTTSPGVGAHEAHLTPGPIATAFDCTQCHTVPTGVGAHPTGTVDLTWGPIATAAGAAPSYSGGACSNYCHGASLQGGTNARPQWTKVDGTQATCGTCHGLPPASYPSTAHPRYVLTVACAICHPETATVDASGADTILVSGGKHVNGVVEPPWFAGHPAGWALPPTPPPTPGVGGAHRNLTAPGCPSDMNAYYGNCASVPRPTCIDCHGDGSDFTPDGGPSKISCAACHDARYPGMRPVFANPGLCDFYGQAKPCACDLCH